MIYEIIIKFTNLVKINMMIYYVKDYVGLREGLEDSGPRSKKEYHGLFKYKNNKKSRTEISTKQRIKIYIFVSDLPLAMY